MERAMKCRREIASDGKKIQEGVHLALENERCILMRVALNAPRKTFTECPGETKDRRQ
jgi:hypothetical protein